MVLTLLPTPDLELENYSFICSVAKYFLIFCFGIQLPGRVPLEYRSPYTPYIYAIMCVAFTNEDVFSLSSEDVTCGG